MILRLSVETFRGPVGRAPSLQLAVWLNWDGGDRPWDLTVLERRDDGAFTTREGTVEKEVIDILEARLRSAGLGSRPVRVSDVIDTSDTAGQVRIRALWAASWTEAVVPMLSSGFEGEDAEAVRDFLSRLLDAAGVASKEARRATLGA